MFYANTGKVYVVTGDGKEITDRDQPPCVNGCKTDTDPVEYSDGSGCVNKAEKARKEIRTLFGGYEISCLL